jgi:hypothetical protein
MPASFKRATNWSLVIVFMMDALVSIEYTAARRCVIAGPYGVNP